MNLFIMDFDYGETPSQPASRAISHQKALPLSLQLKRCEWAQSLGRLLQSWGWAEHQEPHQLQASESFG
jgi:hypothetical protein